MICSGPSLGRARGCGSAGRICLERVTREGRRWGEIDRVEGLWMVKTFFLVLWPEQEGWHMSCLQSCGASLARPVPQMKCQNWPVDTHSYLLCLCSDARSVFSQHNFVLEYLLLFLSLWGPHKHFHHLLFWGFALAVCRFFLPKQISTLCDYFQMAKIYWS